MKEDFNKTLDKLEKKLDDKLRKGKVKAKLGKGKKSKIPGFSYWFQK